MTPQAPDRAGGPTSAGGPSPTSGPSRNPLRSEDAAFRLLLRVAGAALAVIALALLLQAL